MIELNSMGLRAKVNGEQIEIYLLDQTLLPHQEQWLNIKSNDQMIEAIKALRVRGAPLIGVAASLMIAKLAASGLSKGELVKSSQALYEARPTAVNLMVCVNRMTEKINKAQYHISDIVEEAIKIFHEDVELCEKIANNGAGLITDGDAILTHCNTGGLATAGAGTALAVIRKAHEQGKKIHVFVDETRPLLQGGRLTTWELQKLGIPCTLITDSMAAHLMSLGKIDKVIVGSDRIAINGDFANKIGTYSAAVNSFYHRIPFYVAAPYTTVDTECVSGEHIPIEQRAADEVRGATGTIWAPKDVSVYNPSFDVTPAQLVTAWILDKAVFQKKDIDQGVLKLC